MAATAKTRSRSETKAAVGVVAKSVESQRSLDPAIEQRRREEANKIAVEKTVERLESAFSKAGIELGNALNAIQTQVLDTRRELDELLLARDELIKEIEELRGKEVVAAALTDLLREHSEKEAALKATLAAQEATVQEALNDARQAEKRRQEEFEYQFSKNERTRFDALEQQIRVTREAAEDKISALRAEARELEAGIDSKRILMIEEEINKKVEAKTASRVNAIKAQLDADKRVQEAEVRATIQTKEAHITHLMATLEERDKEITELRSELSKARAEVGEIANNAINLGSGRDALERISKLVETQNQTARRS